MPRPDIRRAVGAGQLPSMLGCCMIRLMSIKVTVELDEKVRRALKQAAVNSGRPEREIHEEALRSFLHLDIIDRLGRTPSELSEVEATRIANEEVHAARRERKSRSRR